jgi:hypothetical protein
LSGREVTLQRGGGAGDDLKCEQVLIYQNVDALASPKVRLVAVLLLAVLRIALDAEK